MPAGTHHIKTRTSNTLNILKLIWSTNLSAPFSCCQSTKPTRMTSTQLMTLKKAKIAENDWAGHKEVFLSFYDVKGTAKLNFFSLHEMKQGPTEKVRDFWTKVQLHMDRIKDSVDVQEQIETLEKQDFPVANMADIQKECCHAAEAMQDSTRR